jgi:hypothetical protein
LKLIIQKIKNGLKNYKNLWCTNSPQNDNDEPETTSPPSTETDEISDEEF